MILDVVMRISVMCVAMGLEVGGRTSVGIRSR